MKLLSAIMDEGYAIKDFRGKDKYLAFGNYCIFIPALNFLTGFRAIIEKTVLHLSYYLDRPRKKLNAEYNLAWQSVKKSLDDPIETALLLYTGWYKESVFVGFIKTKNKSYFVKLFSEREKVSFEIHQNEFVNKHFSGPFLTMPISFSKDFLVANPVIERQRSVLDKDHIEQKLLTLLDGQQKANFGQYKLSSEFLPLDINFIADKTECKTVLKKADQWIKENDEIISLVPVHGDMTSWNMFVTHDEKIVLIDYECSGWHVPYYDIFHYILQPFSLGNNTVDAREKLAHFWQKDEKIKKYFILYLVDQLYQNLNDFVNRDFKYERLVRAMNHKKLWLEFELDNQ